MQAVVNHYGLCVELTEKWRSVRCISPEHTDRKASARANIEGYACLACGLRGNAVGLIMEMEGCDFRSAVAKYKAITGSEYNGVSEPVTRKSWGIPPFSERTNPGGDPKVSSRVRARPDLWR